MGADVHDIGMEGGGYPDLRGALQMFCTLGYEHRDQSNPGGFPPQGGPPVGGDTYAMQNKGAFGIYTPKRIHVGSGPRGGEDVNSPPP